MPEPYARKRAFPSRGRNPASPQAARDDDAPPPRVNRPAAKPA
ncbi:hypothetical protein [Actinacidiphila glaucinigra]